MQKVIASLLVAVLMGTVLIVPILAQEDDSPQWWDESVWYLLFVRSFNDSDGDGIGDFQGIIERLDYLNDGDPNTTDDLGITAIWLLPIMEAESYHGYDITDYKAFEQDYGTAEDFQMLLDAAHERGIRIVVDLVINHTSSQHPWFLASAAGDPEFVDWYVWEDENPGYRGPWGENAWYQNSENDQWYYAPFWSEMPDLNYDNPAVQAEMDEIVRFWVEDIGVDGFRLDAIKYLIETEVDGRIILEDTPENRQYLADLDALAKSINPEAVTVGEVFDGTAVVKRYMDDDAMDMAFEFDLADAIIASSQGGRTRNVEQQLGNVLRTYETGDWATFTTNHDLTRLLTQLGEDENVNRVAANLLLMLPGAPFLYYGEEIGMTGDKANGDEDLRRPMQWDDSETAGFTTGTPWYPLADNAAERTVAAQTDDPTSLLSHYRNLIHLRNANPALNVGETMIIDSTSNDIFSVLRYTDEQTLLVVMNVDDREVDEFTLDLSELPVDGISSAEVIYSDAGDLTLAALEGDLAAYAPIDVPMPIQSLVVIELN